MESYRSETNDWRGWVSKVNAVARKVLSRAASRRWGCQQLRQIFAANADIILCGKFSGSLYWIIGSFYNMAWGCKFPKNVLEITSGNVPLEGDQLFYGQM